MEDEISKQVVAENDEEAKDENKIDEAMEKQVDEQSDPDDSPLNLLNALEKFLMQE